MKKLTVLFAAVVCAAMSFAACNEYGWTNKGEMFLALQADCNDSIVAHGKFALEVVKEENDSIFYLVNDAWQYWEDVEAANTLPTGSGDFFAYSYQKNTEILSVLETEKWVWLKDYITAAFAAGNDVGRSIDWSYAPHVRANVQAFFFNSPTYKGSDANPWSYSFEEAGKYANFQAAWGSSFCIKEDCNPDGWKNKGEMFLQLQSEINDSLVAHTKSPLAVVKEENDSIFYMAGGTWKYWEDVEAANTPVENENGDFAACTYNKQDEIYSILRTDKWQWLLDYIKANYKEGREDHADFDENYAILIRCNIQAFFFNSPTFKGGDANPWSFDYTEAGKYANFQAAWGESFCTGGMATVTYVLPEGAITNDYGWTCGEDMFRAFLTDYNTYGGVSLDVEGCIATPEKFYNDTYQKPVVEGIFTDANYSDKWGWLLTFLTDASREYQGQEPTLTGPMMRGAVDNFFHNGALNAGAWHQSYDATSKGVTNYEVYASYWKHAFANPTEFAADAVITLNAPYKEGETFRGWFLDEIGATEPLTTISAVNSGMTLYGLFGKYVSTIAEVIAQEDNTEAYTSGVVTFINGKNIYIQDATGGLLVYTTETPTCTVGQKITVSGTKVLYGGAPEVSNGVVEKMEAGSMPAAQTLELSVLVANPLKYFAQRVQVNDVRIAKYDDKGNPFVVSGPDTVQCYKMVVNQTEFPVGQRVNLTAIAGYYNAFQFVGDIAGFEKIIYQGLKDTCTYDELVFIDEDGDGGAEGETYTYTIENNWLISENLGNWAANKPNQVAEQCRGMAVKDGIIYITYRASNTPNRGELKLLRYDAETGEKLADLPLKDYVFCEPAADTTGTRCVLDEETGISYLAEGYEWNYDEFTSNPIFGPNTDMHVDYDGNILVANLPTEGHVYQIWKLTEDANGVLDGGGELVLYVGGQSGVTDFATRYPDDPAIRLDRFDLAGSVDGDAWIFAASENSNIVYEMDIVNGKWDGECWNHVCQNGEVAFSYSPRISVVDGGEAFYVDGFATYPALFANDGTLLEDFAGIVDDEGEEVNPSAMGLLQNDDGTAPATGECGVHEFPVGGAYFLAMGAGSYEGAYQPYGTHLVFRFKNDNRHFYEMQRAWELSKDGFGANKNAQFNYMQCHIEKDDLTTELYLFVAENGIGKYTIKADKYFGEQETGLEAVKASVKAGDVKKVMMNGRMFIIRDGKAFSAMGQKF